MASIQLSIADPCHENWDNMLPEEKGRFCLNCQKTVIDFTNMSDGQVFDYFKNYTGSTCGQFTSTQLNRNIIQPKTHSIGRWKYFWQMLLPAVFAFYKSEGQMLKGKVAPKAVCKADPQKPVPIRIGMVVPQAAYKVLTYKLQGTIINEKGEPLSSASIASKNGKYTVADSAGHFSAELIPGTNLIVSSVGYEARSFSYDSLQPAAIQSIQVEKEINVVIIAMNIQLTEAVTNPLNAVVVGHGPSDLIVRLGGISVVRSRTFFSKPISDRTIDNLPQLKIFPNPIQLGQSFQMSLQVRKMGDYQIRIIDAAGKILMEKRLSITSKNQTETIDGKYLQYPGVYFINILNPAGDKKDRGITGKIVVQ